MKSAVQVALEAGDSPAIIFWDYRELTAEETAQAWFAIGHHEEQSLISDRQHSILR